MKKYSIIYLTLTLSLFACDKDEPFENPYDNIPQDTSNTGGGNGTAPPPNTIQGIHANILKPTCANAGCHDGHFEPDFRTPESSYSTLVYQPIIKNDPLGTYSLRVKPGDHQKSVLYQRLVTDIDGQSGIMPLEVDPESDWIEKKNEYIQNIADWIDNGALDMDGNAPAVPDLPPQLEGIAGVEGNNSKNSGRDNIGLGPLLINDSTSSLELYFALKDDNTPINQLSYNKIKITNDPSQWDNVSELPLVSVTPVLYKGYFGDTIPHQLSATVDPSPYNSGETVYIRLYVDDGSNGLTELPSDESPEYIKTYASFRIK